MAKEEIGAGSVLYEAEECDVKLNDPADPLDDYCSKCKKTCPDGDTDAETGEECDPLEGDNLDAFDRTYCSPDCKVLCGNGTKDGEEDCDYNDEAQVGWAADNDGNLSCTENCILPWSCGNGVIEREPWMPNPEECDPEAPGAPGNCVSETEANLSRDMLIRLGNPPGVTAIKACQLSICPDRIRNHLYEHCWVDIAGTYQFDPGPPVAPRIPGCRCSGPSCSCGNTAIDIACSVGAIGCETHVNYNALGINIREKQYCDDIGKTGYQEECDYLNPLFRLDGAFRGACTNDCELNLCFRPPGASTDPADPNYYPPRECVPGESGSTFEADPDCTTNCKTRCNDGYYDSSGLSGIPDKRCDPGGDMNNPTCNPTDCIPYCGDGVPNAPDPSVYIDFCERTDLDGRVINEECYKDCTPKCGDGVENTQSDEADVCDDFVISVANPIGGSALCTEDCQFKGCGDGDGGEDPGEQCDNGPDTPLGK